MTGVAAMIGLVIFVLHGACGAVIYENTHANLTAPPPDVPANVSELDLSHNLIAALPAFPSFHDLQEIELKYNLLTEFPDLCVVNATLERVSFSSNEITSVPAAHLGCLTLLTHFFIPYNRLTSLPVVTLTYLTSIRLHENRFATLPPVHVIAPNVKYVTSSYNPLVGGEIPETLLLLGAALAKITLGGIDLQSISLEQISRLPLLSYAKFDNTQLSEVPDMGPSMRTLDDLILSDNPIVTVNPDLIQRFTALTNLDLHDCLVTALPLACQLPPALVVNLNNNPLVCDCHSKELMMAAVQGVVLVSPAPCVQPPHLSSTLLADIDHKDMSCDQETLLSFTITETRMERFTCTRLEHDRTLVPASTRGDCAVSCLSSPGCAAFTYNSTRHCDLFYFRNTLTATPTIAENIFQIN